MSRERRDTADSSASLGIRDRTNTLGSVNSADGDFLRVSAGSSPPRPYSQQSYQFPNTSRNQRLIDWIQSWRIRKTPIITGLDRLTYSSAAESVVILGVQPPRYLWYMLSGGICDIIQFGIDIMLHFTWQIQDASLCWALGFILSIAFRHSFHRYLVFGDYVGGYYRSLARMYGGYSIIIVLSTGFNILMTRVIAIPHYMAWITTLLWTGIANYFILKKIWSFGGVGTKV